MPRSELARTLSPTIPRWLIAKLEPDETATSGIVGGEEAGFVLTNRRLLAWRGRRSGVPMALDRIDRIVFDKRASRPSLLLVVSTDIAAPPLSLGVLPVRIAEAWIFVEAIAAAVVALGVRHKIEVDRGDWDDMTVIAFRR